MLEGLEVREVQLSRILENKDGRFDTDFWIKEPILNPQLTYRRIGECLKVSQYGISIEMNEEGIGQPIYRMNEIHNMLCDFSVSKFAQVTNSEILKFKLNNRDVLFNRTNSFEWVGRTGIYYKQPNRDFIFASYLVRFVPDENIIIPEYLTAYLNSKYGIWDLKRRARQSINQTNINPEEVKEILIPILPIRFQLEIKSNFDKARDNFIESERVYQTAQNLLLEHLGLKDFNPPAQAVNVKSFADSFGTSGRLDAEFYQEKYEKLIDKIKSYPKGYNTLDYFIKDFSTGFAYKSETYTETGIPLIRINNIGNGTLDISNAMLIPQGDISLSPKDVANENDILISMSGTIGNSCKVPKGVNAVVNQRIMRISPQNINVEVLPLIINSIIGKYQLERMGTGGVQTNISANDIKQIVIPNVEEKIQTQIADLIRQSNYLRIKSKGLLEKAKKAVELAIEKDQESALDFIKGKQTNDCNVH
ncbi:MAG: restriction endonuclease subunit S [Haemophilus parainfluenzae]|nr:restriction endonuclease subunit S [Haemophilus parainfluenzae]